MKVKVFRKYLRLKILTQKTFSSNIYEKELTACLNARNADSGRYA